MTELEKVIKGLDKLLITLENDWHDDLMEDDTGELREQIDTLNNAIGLLKSQNTFNRWLANLCAHEDEIGGAEPELICRRLVKMGYVKVVDNHYEVVEGTEND